MKWYQCILGIARVEKIWYSYFLVYWMPFIFQIFFLYLYSVTLPKNNNSKVRILRTTELTFEVIEHFEI